MPIGDRKVIAFHYTLKNTRGEEIETSRGGEPSLYLHGAGNILPAIEQALEGKASGDRVQLTLEPGEAYGERREGQVQRVPAKYLRHEGKLRPGQVVHLNTEEGGVTATVLKVGKFSVDVDLNHPLAGEIVSFDIEVMDVRDATEEEIAHGHAHGAGGHHH